MSLKHVAIVVLFFAISSVAVGCCEKADADPQVAELKARVAALEAANGALEKQLGVEKPANAAAPADCAAQLAACNERAAKCEKDPFTGPKYLTEDAGAQPAPAAKKAQ
jgi:hypothetical protein